MVLLLSLVVGREFTLVGDELKLPPADGLPEGAIGLLPVCGDVVSDPAPLGIEVYTKLLEIDADETDPPPVEAGIETEIVDDSELLLCVAKLPVELPEELTYSDVVTEPVTRQVQADDILDGDPLH